MGSSHDGDGVIVKYSRDVFRGKFIRGVAYEETCLADRTVADDDTPNADHRLALCSAECSKVQE
jgi:hypothetical protein